MKNPQNSTTAEVQKWTLCSCKIKNPMLKSQEKYVAQNMSN